jgi:hypothetical protein
MIEGFLSSFEKLKGNTKEIKKGLNMIFDSKHNKPNKELVHLYKRLLSIK